MDTAFAERRRRDLIVAFCLAAIAAVVPLFVKDVYVQNMMVLTLMLTSKGIAAVPRASLVVLAGTLASFGLPLEGIAVILGVDEIMDMGRTATNLIGNCLATAVIGRWEGELDDAKVAAMGVAQANASAGGRA